MEIEQEKHASRKSVAASIERDLANGVYANKGQPMTVHAAVLTVSRDLLHATLMLPDDAKIQGISYDPSRDLYLIRLEGPEEFPIVTEGMPAPEMNAQYERVGMGRHRLVGFCPMGGK